MFDVTGNNSVFTNKFQIDKTVSEPETYKLLYQTTPCGSYSWKAITHLANQGIHLSWNCRLVMKPCSQESATGSYLEINEDSQYPSHPTPWIYIFSSSYLCPCHLLPLGFPIKICKYTVYLNSCYMPCTSHPPWFDYPNT